MAPPVSVLVAAHDAAATLDEALASVAAQTAADWECVVVDDGSADATAAVAEARAAADPRFRLLARGHEGVVAARNAGLAACEGDWIALLDADDRMHPRRLEAQLATLAADPRLVALGTHVRYFPEDSRGEGRRAYEAWLNRHRTPADLRRDRYVEMPLGHPTMTVRADLLQGLGYRDLGWPEDWDLLQRLFETTEPEAVGVVPEVLHDWRLRPDSLSRRSPAYTEAAFTRCRAAFLARGFLAAHADYALVGYGDTGKALRRALDAEGRACRRIYELHPGRVGQRIDGAPVLHRDELAAPAARELPLLVSVAGQDARDTLRGVLADAGHVDGTGFVCCA
ncbi:MAG: glycosyltransferase family 2 protein [Planctomycetota bacterium]